MLGDGFCFVISPIGDDDSPARKRSDQVFKYIINPVASKHGYKEVVRADQREKPGVITTQIVKDLIRADLIFADLTDHNPNVFYELAITHVLRKPVVQLIQTGERIPFDLSQLRTIRYDLTDPDKLEACKERVSRQVSSVEADPGDSDNPISVTLDLKALADRHDPSITLNTEVLDRIQSVQDSILVLISTFGQLPEQITSLAVGHNAVSGVSTPALSTTSPPSATTQDTSDLSHSPLAESLSKVLRDNWQTILPVAAALVVRSLPSVWSRFTEMPLEEPRAKDKSTLRS